MSDIFFRMDHLGLSPAANWKMEDGPWGDGSPEDVKSTLFQPVESEKRHLLIWFQETLDF